MLSLFKIKWYGICPHQNLKGIVLTLFADVVHVSNHWILAQAMAHAPVPNFDVT